MLKDKVINSHNSISALKLSSLVVAESVFSCG